jgi:uracil-DNA glycosylase
MQKIMSDPTWQSYLGPEFSKSYMQQLLSFLEGEQKAGKKIFPPEKEILNAFNHTPFEKVKVVILGQDPYHGEGQAHGLCFSVNRGVRLPPSLANIFKELHSDLGIQVPSHGNLEKWAQEGVLLLNNVLTVEEGKAGSHFKKGWEQFTDKAIETLNEKKQNVVYLLWGAHAQKKASSVDPEKNLIIKSAHPSPLSSYRDFFGTKPFSKTNEYLQSKGLAPVNWAL